MNNEKELKKEVVSDTKTGLNIGNLTLKISKDMLTLVVLVSLIVISGVQTVKLSGLRASSAEATTAPASSGSTSSGSGSSLPVSLQNLPSQVGGC